MRAFILIILTIGYSELIFCQMPTSCTEEGQEKQLSAGYFLCQQGAYVPVACSSPDGAKVNIGSAYTKPEYYYVFECKKIDTNSIHLTPVACQQQGNKIQPGDSYVLEKFWYTCTQKAPNNLILEAGGCITESGDRVKANGTMKSKDFVYNCFTKGDGSIYFQPQACIVDGKEYAPDTDVDVEARSCWYKCQREGTTGLRLQVVGCLEAGKKYPVGEEMIFGDFVYKCIRNTDESVTREPVGCVESAGNKTRHKFGERWTEGEGELKYVHECKGDSKSVSKRPVQCIYDGQGGPVQLDGGCMKRLGNNTLLQCYKGEMAVYGQLIKDAPADFEDRYKNTGLKLC